jgi:hypothetical protein
LIGLFVGPIVLAITWELLGIWLWQGANETKSILAAAANK